MPGSLLKWTRHPFLEQSKTGETAFLTCHPRLDQFFSLPVRTRHHGLLGVGIKPALVSVTRISLQLHFLLRALDCTKQ